MRIKPALALVLAVTPAVGSAADEPRPPTEEEIAAVPCNAAGWPLKTYVAYAGVLGPGKSAPTSHVVAHNIARDGWTQYVDRQIQPLLDGPNPPARIVIHCVGPAWPRVRDGEVVFYDDIPGRWFEYDWPLTVAEGRPREDGRGKWPGMPAYLDDFAAAWRSVADGSRSGGFPIETYAYTGMLRVPWLEEMRVAEPEAYRERLIRVAEFFRDAGFAGMYVDAAGSKNHAPGCLGLKVLKEVHGWDDFFVGVEAYPAGNQDDSTAEMPYFMSHWLLKRQHPRWPDFLHQENWYSRLSHKGLIVWHNNWGGGEYALTPEKARLVAAMGDDLGVSWGRWKELSPEFPPQQVAPLPQSLFKTE